MTWTSDVVICRIPITWTPARRCICVTCLLLSQLFLRWPVLVPPSSYSLCLRHVQPRLCNDTNSKRFTCEWLDRICVFCPTTIPQKLNQAFSTSIYNSKPQTLKPRLHVNQGAAEVSRYEAVTRHWQQRHADGEQRRLSGESTNTTRGQSAQDPPNPSRRLFCSDAISDEDIDRTWKGPKCNGRAPTGILFIAHICHLYVNLR